MITNTINLTPKYYFLDLEVDSVPKEKGEPLASITQIAILDPSRAKGQKIFNAYVQPHEELCRKQYGDVNGVKRRYFNEVWPDAIKWVNNGLDGNRKAVIIMHNGYAHDWPILKNEVARVLSKTDSPIPNFWKPFDTCYLKNTLHIPGDGSLTGLCHTLGAKVRQAHDAVEDVKMTRAIFKKMVGDAPMDKVLVAALGQHPIKNAVEIIKPYFNIKIKEQQLGLNSASNINSLVNPKLVVFDFESTGLFPKPGEGGTNPRVVQLAGYIPSVDKIFNELIHPGMAIPKQSSAIHGIYDRHVQDAKPFNVVWLQFEEFIETHLGKTANSVAVLAGHNIWGYDMKLYNTECERTGIKKKFWKSFDTLALARNQFKGIKVPKKGFFKQEYLVPLLGHNFIGAHDAQNDVVASYQLLQSMIEGVSEEKFTEAILLKNPVLALGQLCKDVGGFDGQLYFELYTKACSLTIDFAKLLFDEINNDLFFEPNNLSCMLGVKVESGDPEAYTLWRIFLKLTKGIDRKDVNKALKSKKPLEDLTTLFEKAGSFNSKHCLENNKISCEMALPLAKALFSYVQDKHFFEPKKLLSLFGIETSSSTVSLFEVKRLFQKLTAGISEESLESAFASKDPVNELLLAIKENGSFDPTNYVKPPVVKTQKPVLKNKEKSINDFFSNSDMDIIEEQKTLKRKKSEDIESVKADANEDMLVESEEKEILAPSQKKQKLEKK